jgi:tetratricopeptide (TPR) repeat protein
MVRALVGVVVSLSLQAADAPLPPAHEVMKELRRIEAAGYHGTLDQLRMDYTSLAQEHPADPMPRVFAAWVSLPSDDAWNQLKAIAQIHPENPWVHYGMGRIYTKWKMYDQARAELAQALKGDPKFFPALTVKADLAAAKEAWPEAEALYRQVLALDDDPLARTGLGFVLLKQNKKEEALTQLKVSTRAYPEQPAALAILIPLLAEGKDPAVLDAAQAAADLRPKDKDARRMLADLRFAAGDAKGAVQDYEKVLQLTVPDAPTLRRLAGLYKDLGEKEREEKTLRALGQLEPANAEPLLRVAALRAEAKDPANAELALVEAVSREPRRVDAQLELAKLKLAQGDLPQALEHFRAAKAVAPGNAEALAGVEKLETTFKLRKSQLKGNVNGIYWAVSASLDKLYAERRAAAPALAGKLKLKVRLNAQGTADGVDVLEDTLRDPVLLGHVYFSLRDAEYWEKKKLEPVIDFELGGKKGK